MAKRSATWDKNAELGLGAAGFGAGIQTYGVGSFEERSSIFTQGFFHRSTETGGMARRGGLSINTDDFDHPPLFHARSGLPVLSLRPYVRPFNE